MSSEEKDQLYATRHSAAHIMASAIQHLWPQTKFGVGPVIDNGFYYDIDLGSESLSEDDFSAIEKEMQRVISSDHPFEHFEMGIEEAITWAKQTKQPYKLELLNDLKRAGTTLAKDLDSNELGLPTEGGTKTKSVSFYRCGDFTDLCRGPHVTSTGKISAYKLTRTAGAYWRGKESNPQLQRIYGVAFLNKAALSVYLKLQEQAKLRDHRVIGQQLDLFTNSDLVGSGLPLFTPRGTVLRDKLGEFSQELQSRYGFERVWTPHIAREELYKTSGHFDKFPERFSVTSAESDDKFMMKPMSCPHHIQIFLRKPWSYRELPIRYMENATVYRDEKSGELHGLSRVRASTQDDGHIFCREEDIEDELSLIVKMVKDCYKVLDMSFYARLSYRDQSDAYLGDAKLWQKAEAAIAKVAKEEGLKTIEERGEAAFYGPKIDFMVIDALGREWQCATVQLDFVLPGRFKLRYTDVDGTEKQPVMLHKALMGTLDRFMSVYIEHTAGKFPVWLAPEQLRVVTVNQDDNIVAFAGKIAEQAKAYDVRVSVDASNQSVGKKIRSAEVMKIPYIVVVGETEIKGGKLTPRIRKDLGTKTATGSHSIEEVMKHIANESEDRAIKTSM